MSGCASDVARISIFGCRSLESDTEGDGWAEVELDAWASGSSLIYVADGLAPSRTRVVLESKAIVTTFSLRIEFFKGGVQVSEETLQVSPSAAGRLHMPLLSQHAM